MKWIKDKNRLINVSKINVCEETKDGVTLYMDSFAKDKILLEGFTIQGLENALDDKKSVIHFEDSDLINEEDDENFLDDSI